MIRVHCRTNLDGLNNEDWPTELPTVPRVGDYINSGTIHSEGRYVQLKVVQVTWVHHLVKKIWYPEIEMHLPSNRWGSISHFLNWYDMIRGKLSQEGYERRSQQ